MRTWIAMMHGCGGGCMLVGTLLYADALGCARAYGGTWGDLAEIIVATLVVVAGAWLASLSGVWFDRMVRASRPRQPGRRG